MSAAGRRGTYDVAVVGAGAAGMYAALCAAREGGRVALLSAMPRGGAGLR
jgi:predicted flavoprotein YhiN